VHCPRSNGSTRKKKRSERGIWQRRFWEHQIRNERDYQQHMNYVYFNPVKHGYVDSVKDWVYSTFHRDVEIGLYSKEWGSDVELQLSAGEAS